jgi:hypothetical protein
MADFSWTNAAGGVVSPPPGPGTNGAFGDLVPSHVVTVTNKVEITCMSYDATLASRTTVAGGGLLHIESTLQPLGAPETITYAARGNEFVLQDLDFTGIWSRTIVVPKARQ